jgi:hypothetical protein
MSQTWQDAKDFGTSVRHRQKEGPLEFAKTKGVLKNANPCEYGVLHSFYLNIYILHESDHISGNVGPNFINNPQNHPKWVVNTVPKCPKW